MSTAAPVAQEAAHAWGCVAVGATAGGTCVVTAATTRAATSTTSAAGSTDTYTTLAWISLVSLATDIASDVSTKLALVSADVTVVISITHSLALTIIFFPKRN